MPIKYSLCFCLFVFTITILVPVISWGDTWAQKINLNGYFSFEYEKAISGVDGDQNGSFDSDLFDLVLNIQASPKLRISADLTWEHGASTESDYGNVAVEYAFAQYMITPMIQLRAGKMFTHFGIYNEIHTAKPAYLTSKEPFATNKNDKIGSKIRFYPRWLTGIAAIGHGILGEGWDYEYIVQLANGDNSSAPYETDGNSEKAIAARVLLGPTLGDYTVGVSLYQDTLTDAVETIGKSDLFSYGAHMIWENKYLGAEFEYVAGSVNHRDSSSLNRHAFSVLGFLKFHKIRPFFRFEYLNPNIDIEKDSAYIYVYGANYLLENNLALKFDVTSLFTEAANSGYFGRSFSEVHMAIAIGF